VKKIHLKNAASLDTPPLFVIALLEHQSRVNFRMPFKLLFYMISIWENYEKEADEKGIKPTAKDFKYPPILPLVFYDGPDEWTAQTSFLQKVELGSSIFEKYTPKFEYELIDLNKYNETDILKFGDVLSVVLLIDKIRQPQDIDIFQAIPEEYIQNLTCNVPDSLKKVLSDVVRALLTKIEVPDEEIEMVTEKINQRRSNIMFDWSGLDGYSVKETRRQVREEERQKYEQEKKAIAEKYEKKERQEKKAIAEKYEQKEKSIAEKYEQKEKAIAEYLRAQGLSDDIINGALSVQSK
jgi:hypothetical protein